MHYPIVIEPGDAEHAFGVIVPDLEGCFSAGDTLEQALANAREAIELHLEALLDAGQPLPEPTRDLARLTREPDLAGHIFALVEVPLESLDDAVERVNITVPRRVLKAIDEAAVRAGESRSGFMAASALARAREIESAASA
jgi:predicted RNase H-like HicB family nuclease